MTGKRGVCSFSIKEVAVYFGMNPETIRRWAYAGTIPSYKVGKSYRFDIEEVKAALRHKK